MQICRTKKNMSFFSPRPLLRVESEHRVKVSLQDNINKELLPGSCFGVMVNISQGGACLVLSKMLLEGRHLFFSTLNNEHFHLVLSIENPESGDDTFTVSARSVWMDSCRYQNTAAFKVGLCFHDSQKEIFQLFKKN